MSAFLEVDEASFVRAQQALRVFQEPNMTKVMRRSALAGARVLRGPLRASAPRGHNAPAEPPRDLAGSIRIAYSRRGARAKGIAYVIGPMGKKAFHRRWVTGGTKPHRIPKQGRLARLATPFGVFRSIQHPGARANPFVARVGHQYRGQVREAMIRSIVNSAKKAGQA